MKRLSILLCLATTLFCSPLQAQSISPDYSKEFYFSWGYNTEWYTPSDIHVSQPGLNSDYTFHAVAAHDRIGWNKLFDNPLTIPQYNYRLGFFFNKTHDLGFEISFDHTKFIVTQGQTVSVKGTKNGVAFDANYLITEKVLRYQLNNGANFLLFNLVKRIRLQPFTCKKDYIKTDLLVKFGIGPVIPHVDNTIFGNDNDAHFQLGGWNTGFETDIRVTFKKYIYLELCEKMDYASYSHLRVYEGLADQSFFCAEFIGNIGITIPIGGK